MKDAKKEEGRVEDDMESLGLYKKEEIGDYDLAKGNDDGNLIPVRKPEPLGNGFTIK